MKKKFTKTERDAYHAKKLFEKECRLWEENKKGIPAGCHPKAFGYILMRRVKTETNNLTKAKNIALALKRATFLKMKSALA